MCQEHKHNFINHLLGRCKHQERIQELHQQIAETRQITSDELEEFNQRLNIIIKDENVRITLKNIKKVSGK
jgi:hypothetical protein